MTVRKQSVSFNEQAFAHAQALVDVGEYPNVSAAVSGELARARAARQRDEALWQAEVQRRLSLPTDHWEAVDTLTNEARGWLSAR